MSGASAIESGYRPSVLPPSLPQQPQPPADGAAVQPGSEAGAHWGGDSFQAASPAPSGPELAATGGSPPPVPPEQAQAQAQAGTGIELSANDFASTDVTTSTSAAGATTAVRSGDVQPLQNPGKIGVVLNAPVNELPRVEELTAQGVGRARITLSAAYLQNDPAAQPGTPGSELNDAKAQELATLLGQYKNAGIEVTLNLPPELVNGKPEFERAGTPTYQEGDLLIHQHGEVKGDSVSDAAWQPYQDAYVARTAELANRLGPYVDSWEVGNEPDALEKVYIHGKLPTREGDPEGTPHPDQAYVTDQNGQQQPVVGSFDPGLPPARYGQLLNAAYQAIKDNDNGARDPNDPEKPDPNNKNTVITAGLVAGDAEESLDGDDRKISYLEQAWNATPGGLRFDALGVHPYTKTSGESFNATAENYQRLSEKLTGRRVDVYMTEASPGPGSPEDPGYQQDYEQYIRDISGATDGNAGVAGTYFFWGGSFDDHAGLTDMPAASETLRRLLGK